MNDIIIRPITAADDAAIAAIIRRNLEAHHLNIPGTAYFDPELDSLSGYYQAMPEKRAYFIALAPDGNVIGGVGLSEFPGFEHCAEVQKLYLCEAAKGRGMGNHLMEVIRQQAASMGFRSLYLETHTNLTAAIGLYQKLGFRQIEKPEAVLHSTMDRFYFLEI